MEITYIHHSCFLAETESSTILFDYWKDPSSRDSRLPRFLERIRRDIPFYVIVSHHHKDHFNPCIFGWSRLHPDIRYVLSGDTARFARHYINPLSSYKGTKPEESQVTIMNPGETVDDGIMAISAFGSTDCGCSWLITPSQYEQGKHSIFHAGDLNAWIWIDESTPEEVREATEAYERILSDIYRQTERIGYCLFPVDSRIGTHWYLGAEMLVRKFMVDHFFPMHFELGESAEEVSQRKEDACRFNLYANRKYGEYIALTTPYTSYMDTSYIGTRALP